MSEPSGSPRASRAVKLVLMGVAGAALLYSCAPGAAGLGGLPYIWFLPNPFFRAPASAPGPGVTPSGPGATAHGAAVPGAAGTDTAKASPSPSAPAQSQRGGFGASGSSGSSGTS